MIRSTKDHVKITQGTGSQSGCQFFCKVGKNRQPGFLYHGPVSYTHLDVYKRQANIGAAPTQLQTELSTLQTSMNAIMGQCTHCLLYTSLGGLSETKEALEGLRERVRNAGLGELHLNAVVWGIETLPTENTLTRCV